MGLGDYWLGDYNVWKTHQNCTISLEEFRTRNNPQSNLTVHKFLCEQTVTRRKRVGGGWVTLHVSVSGYF